MYKTWFAAMKQTLPSTNSRMLLCGEYLLSAVPVIYTIHIDFNSGSLGNLSVIIVLLAHALGRTLLFPGSSTTPSSGWTNPPANWRIQHCNRKAPKMLRTHRPGWGTPFHGPGSTTPSEECKCSFSNPCFVRNFVWTYAAFLNEPFSDKFLTKLNRPTEHRHQCVPEALDARFLYTFFRRFRKWPREHPKPSLRKTWTEN